MDIAFAADATNAIDAVERAMIVNLADYFTFNVTRKSVLPVGTELDTTRLQIQANLAGRRFESLTLDIGLVDALEPGIEVVVGAIEYAFADLPEHTIPIISLSTHVAEKVHAYTQTFADGRVNTRAKDLVDLVLISAASEFSAGTLRERMNSVFLSAHRQTLPTSFPPPPSDWRVQYATMAREVRIAPDLEAGHRLAAAFFDPVLDGSARHGARWHPAMGTWREPA